MEETSAFIPNSESVQAESSLTDIVSNMAKPSEVSSIVPKAQKDDKEENKEKSKLHAKNQLSQ